MKKIMKPILLVVEIISFLLCGVCGLLGVIYEIAGFHALEKILQPIGISHCVRFVWYVTLISVPVLLISSHVRKRMEGR